MHIRKIFIYLVTAFKKVGFSTFNDDINPYDVSEAVIDISGVWSLKTVTRNGVDITKQMDFSRFRLHLNADGTYNIQNYLPFVVSGDGTWSVNDPLHPMLLSFKENGAAEGVNLDFNYPFADGNRTISITLSPGCKSNSYVYTLGRESNGTGK